MSTPVTIHQKPIHFQIPTGIELTKMAIMIRQKVNANRQRTIDTVSGRCCGMSRFACDSMLYDGRCVFDVFADDDHAAESAKSLCTCMTNACLCVCVFFGQIGTWRHTDDEVKCTRID